MNLISAPVLGAAALLAGPTLWQALVTGSVPMELALTRYLVTATIVWVALSAVALLIEATGPKLQPARADTGAGAPDGAAGDEVAPRTGS